MQMERERESKARQVGEQNLLLTYLCQYLGLHNSQQSILSKGVNNYIILILTLQK